jgi:nucleoside-diphosphate-sugar epimerase
MAENALVAVTGASGYIALHVIRELLGRGYAVRGTLRDLARGAQVEHALAGHVDMAGLSFVEADLMMDGGWAAAVADCRYVLHIASPLPQAPPKHEDELIVPARDGALRVLRASAEAGVARVVMTSSVAAILQSGRTTGAYDESDWSDPDTPITAYSKSKTIAERAAWDFVAGLPAEGRPELVTILPSLVLGPLLDADGSASVEAVRKFLAREIPGVPRVGFSLVDVRDVAEAHVRAMEAPEAAGQRFICSGEFYWRADVARVLKAHLAARGYKIATRELPDWAVCLFALIDSSARSIVPQLGIRKEIDASRLAATLDWHPRPPDQSIRDTADSLIELGVV